MDEAEKLAELEEILEELEWGYSTLKNKLTFGMPENEAIKFRERRCKGVLFESIRKLKEILKSEK